MRLAFAVSGKRHTRDAVALVRRLEARGLDEVWLTEDYFERGAFAVAGAILAATDRVRVGIGVVNPWTRHPVLTAMETAALAELAPGRLLLGLGASNERWMQEQLGIPFVRPLPRLRASVDVIRTALRGDHVRTEGEAGHVDARLATEPVEVPIVLGVKGPRALDLAAEVADGVLLSVLSSPPYVRWAAARLGSPVADRLASYVAVDVTTAPGQRREVRDRVRRFTATYLGLHGDHAITREAGLDPELARAFRAGWRDGAPRVDLVSDELLDTFAVAGDLDDVGAGLRRLADAGLATAVLHDQQRPDLDTQLDTITAAAAAAGVTGAAAGR